MSNPEGFKPIYSGPNRTGVCVCGCSWQAHHIMLVARTEYVEATGECYMPGECLAYGHNEAGGMKWNPETEQWEEHCWGYREE